LRGCSFQGCLLSKRNGGCFDFDALFFTVDLVLTDLLVLLLLVPRPRIEAFKQFGTKCALILVWLLHPKHELSLFFDDLTQFQI
jgi:hypothetical protein